MSDRDRVRQRPGQKREHRGGGLETLYPSLYAGQSDLSTVLQAARRSTTVKIREIVALREQVVDELWPRLWACARDMALALRAHGSIWVFGNGGSAADAQALTQLYLAPPAGQPLPATALTNDAAVVTALANDVGFEVVFARQIAAFAKAGDIAIGLSTSGNSVNVLRAFDEAAQRGLLTVGFAGYDGGQMAEADTIAYVFVVPAASVHRIQEAQTTLYHLLWELTQEALQEGGAENEQQVHAARGGTCIPPRCIPEG